jgi:hypothetical protein
MSNYTPGPWVAFIEGEEQQFGTSHVISAGPHMATVAEVPLSSVASIHGEDGETEITAEQAKANARLIAAAPKLLQACAAAIAGFPGWQRMIHAAYEEATGEKP